MAERIANAGRKNMLVDKTSYMDLNRNFQLPGTSSPRRSRRGCLRNLAPTTWSLWTEAPIISWRVFGSKKCPGNRSYESTVVSKHVDFPVNRIDRRYARVLMERMTLYSNRGQWLWRLIFVCIHCSSLIPVETQYNMYYYHNMWYHENPISKIQNLAILWHFDLFCPNLIENFSLLSV